eukprot:gene1371-11993_t
MLTTSIKTKETNQFHVKSSFLSLCQNEVSMLNLEDEKTIKITSKDHWSSEISFKNGELQVKTEEETNTYFYKTEFFTRLNFQKDRLTLQSKAYNSKWSTIFMIKKLKEKCVKLEFFTKEFLPALDVEQTQNTTTPSMNTTNTNTTSSFNQTVNYPYFLKYEPNFDNIMVYPLSNIVIPFKIYNLTSNEYLENWDKNNVTCLFKNENKNITKEVEFIFEFQTNRNGYCNFSINSTSQWDITLWFNSSQITNNSISISSIPNGIKTSDVHPFASLQSLNNFTIFTNFNEQYLLGNDIIYFCFFNSIYFKASINGSNILCLVDFTPFSRVSKTITFIMKSKSSQKMISFNDQTIEFAVKLKSDQYGNLEREDVAFGTNITSATVSMRYVAKPPSYRGISCSPDCSMTLGSTSAFVTVPVQINGDQYYQRILVSIGITLIDGSFIPLLTQPFLVYRKNFMRLNYGENMVFTEKYISSMTWMYDIPLIDTVSASFSIINRERMIGNPLSCQFQTSKYTPKCTLDLRSALNGDYRIPVYFEQFFSYSSEKINGYSSYRLTDANPTYYEKVNILSSFPPKAYGSLNDVVQLDLEIDNNLDISPGTFSFYCYISQYQAGNLELLNKKKVDNYAISPSFALLENNYRYFPCPFEITGNIAEPYYLDIYFSTPISSETRITNNSFEVQVATTQFDEMDSLLLNAQTNHNITIPFKSSTINGFSDQYYFGIIFDNEIKKLNCIIDSTKTICELTSFSNLFPWKGFQYYSIGLYFNQSLIHNFQPKIKFYSLPENIEYLPSNQINITNIPNYIILKSNDSWINFPFDESYYYSIYYSYSNQIDIKKSCEFIDEQHLNCTFISIIGNYKGEIKMKLSLQSIYFHKIASIFISSNDFKSIEFYPQTVNITQSSRIFILGNSFINSQIKIKFNEFNIEKRGIYLNSTMIYCDFIPKMFNPIQLPTKTGISISWDGEYYEPIPGSLLIKPIYFDFSPKRIPQGLSAEFQLDFPPLDVQNDELLVYLEPGMIPMTCRLNYKFCSSGTFLFQNFVDYSFSFKYKNTTDNDIKQQFVQPEKNIIKLYKTPTVTRLETTVIPVEMNAPMKIFGSGFSNAENVKVRLSNLDGSDIVTATYNNIIDDSTVEFTFPRILNVSTNKKIEISYNDFTYTTITSDLIFFENPEIYRIENENYQSLPSIFSFQKTNLTVYGKNFIPSNTHTKIQLFNNLASYTSSEYFFINSEKIVFTAPPIDDFNATETFQYPVQMKFYYSLNDGVHGFTFGVYYVDKFTPIILSSATPNIIGRKAYDISVQGIGFDQISKCQFMIGKNYVYKEPKIVDSSTVICQIDSLDNFESIELFVTNTFNDSSNGIIIQYFDSPIIDSISPDSGVSLGGYDLTITGSGFTNKFNSLWVTIGSFVYQNCIFKSSTQIVCTLHAHPAGESSINFSYNNIDYIESPQKITFEGCSPGTSALNYTISCTFCEEGTYKPTIGFGKCFECPEGTYMNQKNATQCFECPIYSTSKAGAKDVKECYCSDGNFIDPSNKYNCLPCPQGGICQGDNLTKPIAQPGYWYTDDKYWSFYSCYPKSSCGGFGSENCTAGYTGSLCGYCIDGYYKNKNICYSCDSIYLTLLKFFALILFLITFSLINHWKKIPYSLDSDSDDDEKKRERKHKSGFFKKKGIWILNQIIWIRNMIIWTFERPSSI